MVIKYTLPSGCDKHLKYDTANKGTSGYRILDKYKLYSG